MTIILRVYPISLLPFCTQKCLNLEECYGIFQKAKIWIPLCSGLNRHVHLNSQKVTIFVISIFTDVNKSILGHKKVANIWCYHVWMMVMVIYSLSHDWLFTTPWTASRQAPLHGDSPGKHTWVDCHALLQGIFPTQGLNPALPHCRWIFYHLSLERN